jgi:hypothetical protein
MTIIVVFSRWQQILITVTAKSQVKEPKRPKCFLHGCKQDWRYSYHRSSPFYYARFSILIFSFFNCVQKSVHLFDPPTRFLFYELGALSFWLTRYNEFSYEFILETYLIQIWPYIYRVRLWYFTKYKIFRASCSYIKFESSNGRSKPLNMIFILKYF